VFTSAVDGSPRKLQAGPGKSLAVPGGVILSMIGWFCGLFSPSEFDVMGDDQLDDIGIERVTYRERWIDGGETFLNARSEYIRRPDEAGL
jgi:hypothetical protein